MGGFSLDGAAGKQQRPAAILAWHTDTRRAGLQEQVMIGHSDPGNRHDHNFF